MATVSPGEGATLSRGALAAGRVEMLLIADSAGAPMRALQEVEAVAGRGLVGDRYFTGLGHWSDPRWPDQELTLIESELAAALALEPEQLRRNIVVSGIRLEALLDHEFRFGSHGPLAYGVRPCDPCSYVEAFTRAGTARELTGIRGGLRARILEDGHIRAGDAIILAG